MIKSELRALYKSRRLDLDDAELLRLNKALLQHLQSYNWADIKYLHVFLSIDKFKEPNTLLFIDWIRMNYPTINFVVSKSDFNDASMTNYLYDDRIILKENKWGIPEPIEGNIVDEKLIDVVIVPLLVCDKVGNRVGYGKGFYDRFLSKCRKDVVTIGLSFFDLVNKIDDVNEFDYRLNYCITPDELVNFDILKKLF